MAMPSAREQAKEAAAKTVIPTMAVAHPADAANAASDVWEPKFVQAIQLLEKYERAMWLQRHPSFQGYADSHDLWTLKEFVNG